MALIPSIPPPNLEEGLDFILSHLLGVTLVNMLRVNTPDKPLSLLFPRTISTKTTENKQVEVSRREEALARFAQANWIDCRISAYPANVTENPIVTQRFMGLRTATPINLIVMIDLDRCNFKTEIGFRIALTRTISQIKVKVGTSPSIIWSGRGYHIIVPLSSNGVILENVKQFEDIPNISVKFLRYVESYLSLNKSDPQHNNTVSFNNCMLRVPGSINSKNGQPVSIIQKWDNIRPEINYLLAGFARFIINEKYMELLRVRKRSQINSTEYGDTYNNSKINWIEQLLQSPLADYRKYCIWRVLAPYLLNVRKVSEQEAFNIINEWLSRCSELERISFNVNQRINEGLSGAGHNGYLPISYEKLKEENPELYQNIRK